MALPMRGMTTKVSSPKSSTVWITALKNNPDTIGVAPSLLRMRNILIQTFFNRAKFLTTAGQSYYVTEITRPSYFKEVTISRGSP